jgi:hypothetical protein
VNSHRGDVAPWERNDLLRAAALWEVLAERKRRSELQGSSFWEQMQLLRFLVLRTGGSGFARQPPARKAPPDVRGVFLCSKLLGPRRTHLPRGAEPWLSSGVHFHTIHYNTTKEETTMATTVDSRRETISLIGSDKVEGTTVYGGDDQKIGSVQRIMIDKVSGKVAYAVISFGGFLGMGEDYYPLPWANLKYDTNLGGYRVGVTESQLKGAPKFNRNTDWDWSDRNRDKAVYDYYHTPLWY